MLKSRVGLSLIIANLFFYTAYADETLSDALLKTQECLRSQTCETAKTDVGMAADQKALEAAGGHADGKQALYNISADIMPILEKQADGDPVQMQAIMLKAQTDPEGFLNSLPADVQAKIKEAAKTTQ